MQSEAKLTTKDCSMFVSVPELQEGDPRCVQRPRKKYADPDGLHGESNVSLCIPKPKAMSSLPMVRQVVVEEKEILRLDLQRIQGRVELEMP
jgi:hypothetical protein